jgi:transposase
MRRRSGPAREELITLTKKEHERPTIVLRVVKRELKQKDAAELLEPSTCHVRNLVRRVERGEPKGLVHGNRGKPAPKRLAPPLVERIVALVKGRCRDFKPKFAAEKLRQQDKIRVSDEKMRRIMIEARLWRAVPVPNSPHKGGMILLFWGAFPGRVATLPDDSSAYSHWA